jgi:hypothetical protein
VYTLREMLWNSETTWSWDMFFSDWPLTETSWSPGLTPATAAAPPSATDRTTVASVQKMKEEDDESV